MAWTTTEPSPTAEATRFTFAMVACQVKKEAPTNGA
jgi:hypothetical protein